MMHHHYMLYKPDGMLSQFVNNGQKKRRHRLLGELKDFPAQTMSVGRLDLDSEGLLLLTTDGRLSDYICRSGVEKEYIVQLDGLITDAAILALSRGVQISQPNGPHQTRPCQISRLNLPSQLPNRRKKVREDRHGPSGWVSITITEGKFRQIRKMTAAVGFPTLRLVRVRVGHLSLGTMQPCEVRAVQSLDMGFKQTKANFKKEI